MGLLLSMDIGGSTIKLAEGSYGKNGLTIERASSLPVPDESIGNERITNSMAIAEALLDAIRKGGYKAKETVVTVNAPNAVIRDISLPKGNPKETSSMIRNEMIKTYHVQESDVVQYKKIGSEKDEKGVELHRYQAAALDENLVDEYYELFKMMKLKKVVMDININAMDKLFHLCNNVNGQSLKEKASLFIDLGAVYTTAYVQAESEQKLFRHINIGSREIEHILSDETLSSPADIRRRKEEGMNLFAANTETGQYYEILKPYFYNLVDEIRKIIRFYYNRTDAGNNIDQIYIFGGGSKLVGLPEYLEENLNMKTERIERLSGIGGSFVSEILPTHLNAFGALIRY